MVSVIWKRPNSVLSKFRKQMGRMAVLRSKEEL